MGLLAGPSTSNLAGAYQVMGPGLWIMGPGVM